jgi:hypothetical protein
MSLTSYLSHTAETAAGRRNHLERPGREAFQDFWGTNDAHHFSRRECPLNCLSGAEQCRVRGDGWKRPPLLGRQPVEQA